MNKFVELKVTLFLACWLKDKPEFSTDDLRKALYDRFGQKIADEYVSSFIDFGFIPLEAARDVEVDFQNLYNEEDV